MDKHFLEFWGNFFLNASQGQRQLEDVGRWIQGGFTNLEGLSALFQKAYGLDRDSSEYQQQWAKAQQDFRDSFKDYLSLLGVVPREEYVALARKCEELENKVAEQEETIKSLRLLLEGKGISDTVTRGLQGLTRKQGEQFQELLQGLGELLKAPGK